jgi:hypothetical protein
LCGFLALFTLFLLTLSLIFSFGGDAPSLFGRNVYIVKTDRVDFLRTGTALITTAVHPEEIEPGDIVIFRNSENRKGIAEIVSSQVSESVFRFNAVSERGTEMILSESQVVGKAVQYSNFFGALIRFAKSPIGVMIIAVIPCIAILLYEGSKSFFGTRREGQVVPVRKQDENPTYIPRQKMSAAINAYSKTDKNGADDFSDTGSLDFEGDYFDDGKENFPLFELPAAKLPKAEAKSLPAPKVASRAASFGAPLSQKRLNDAIAEVNARKETATGLLTVDFPFINQSNLDSKTGELSSLKEVTAKKTPATEAIKRYTPKKSTNSRNAQRTTPTASIPSLDKLLREDDPDIENARYNIEDILYSSERSR